MGHVDRNLMAFRWGTRAAGAALSLGVALASYLLVHCPLSTRLAEDEHRTSHLSELLKTSSKVHRDNRLLRTEWEQLDRQARKAEARFPAEFRESEFLTAVTEIAKRAGLTMTEFRPGTPQRVGSCSQVEVTLHCTGPYSGIACLVQEVENLPRAVVLQRMVLQGNETMGAEFVFALYFGLTHGT